MTTQNTTLDITNVKPGVIVKMVGKRKKWVVIRAGMIDKAFKDRHFEIVLADFKEVEAALPNPKTQVIGIIGLGKIFERGLENPHNFNDFEIIEKRKIKKTVVKVDFFCNEIRKVISGESDLYQFV